jgi:hypothetical protein
MGNEKYRESVEDLIKRGFDLVTVLAYEVAPDAAKKKYGLETVDSLPSLRSEYESWYSEALATLRQLLPDRVDDFVGHYKPIKPRKNIDLSTFTISDFLHGRPLEIQIPRMLHL